VAPQVRLTPRSTDQVMYDRDQHLWHVTRGQVTPQTVDGPPTRRGTFLYNGINIRVSDVTHTS
jgi:hypothetical protein